MRGSQSIRKGSTAVGSNTASPSFNVSLNLMKIILFYKMKQKSFNLIQNIHNKPFF